ncbi:hypothetical protein ACIBG8_28700 [Nonomuraea sp. NPDC050556]
MGTYWNETKSWDRDFAESDVEHGVAPADLAHIDMSFGKTASAQ